MIRVYCNSPMDERWQARDKEILAAASGLTKHSSGAGVGAGACMGRDHDWEAPDFTTAKSAVARLNMIPGVTAKLKELSRAC